VNHDCGRHARDMTEHNSEEHTDQSITLADRKVVSGSLVTPLFSSLSVSGEVRGGTAIEIHDYCFRSEFVLCTKFSVDCSSIRNDLLKSDHNDNHLDLVYATA